MFSLRTKFLVATSGIIVLLGSAMGYIILAKSSSLLQRQLTQRSLTILQCLADHNVHLLLTNDIYGLRKMFEEVKKEHQEVAYIYVVDAKGKIVVHSFDKGFPRDLPREMPGTRDVQGTDQNKGFDVQFFKTSGGIIRHISRPVLDGKLGYVHLGMWETYIHSEISSLLKHIILVVALVLVGGTALGYVSMYKLLMEPISTLVAATQRVGRGDFAHRVAIKRKDEIGQLGYAFNTMTAHLTQYRDQLLREQAYSANILESMNDVLIAVDSEGRIETINQAAEKLLGYKLEELKGKPVAELFAPQGSEQFMEGPRKALAGENVRDFEVDLVAKSGEHIPIVFNGAPLKDAKGGIVGAVGIGRDLRQIKSLINDLQEAKAQLQQYSTALEKKVAERTKKLREKTRQLMGLNTQLRNNEAAVLNILEDVNEANRELEETKAYLENLIESSVDAIITTDSDGILTFFSKGAQEIFGFSAEEVLGRPLFDYFVSKDGEVEKLIRTLNEQGRLQNYETKLKSKSGGIVHVSLSASLLRDKEGGVIGTLGICKDITESKKAQEKLKRANRVFSILLKSGSQLASGLDFNEVMKRGLRGVVALGYDRARLYLISEDGKYLIGAAQAGKTPEAEFEGVRLEVEKDNYSKKTLAAGKPVIHKRDQLGEEAFKKTPVAEWADVPLLTADTIVGKISVDNIYSQKPMVAEDLRFLSIYAHQLALALTNAKLHSEVKASEKKLRTLFENVKDGIYISTPDGKFIEVNEALVKMLGYSSKEELLSVNIAEQMYLHPREHEEFKRIMAGKGSIVNHETNYRKKNEETITCLESCTAIKDKDGKIVQYGGVIVDVTERRRWEQQLIQADKLASLGVVVSGVAHELNNPLASVLGFSQLLLTEDIDDNVRRDVEIIIREAARCQKIVQNLLTFARHHKPQKTYVSINCIIESVLELRAHELTLNNIEVIKEFDKELPKTVADYHQLQQVFFNLITNAEQAMVEYRHRGRLTVRTERKNNVIRVQVIDNGPGIPQEHLRKIFDPFFTTKEVGKGTGLGLSICYGIIQEHGGRIYARSEIGKGSTFIVEFPIVEQSSFHERSPAADEKDKIPTPKHILVIDDEDAVAEFVRRVLSKQGHQLEVAKNGRMAWEKIRRSSYDAILLDLKMPKMSGQELFKKMQQVSAQLSQRVIFMTGDVAGVSNQSLVNNSGNPCLCKPFSVEQLNEALLKIDGMGKQGKSQKL